MNRFIIIFITNWSLVF